MLAYVYCSPTNVYSKLGNLHHNTPICIEPSRTFLLCYFGHRRRFSSYHGLQQRELGKLRNSPPRWKTKVPQYTSHLRPPSKIPSPGRLQEISASVQNTRSPSMMPPPPSALKRKTLADRAGEPSRPAPAPPSSRPVNAVVKATSIAGVRREPSFSSSVASSRPASVSSIRSVSNSSFSGSVGFGSRPPSAHANRPQTAMSQSRIQQPRPTPSRPSTSLEVQSGTGAIGKRKGRTPFSSNLKQCTEEEIYPKINGSYDTLLNYTSTWVSKCPPGKSFREVSLSTAFKSLTLDSASQATPKVVADASSTPSQIPKRVTGVMNVSEAQSPSKSPQKTPKPLPQFLNRQSNIELAWDTKGRLEDMEQMCSEFKEKIDGATTESNGLKDMITVYKSRSTSGQTLIA